MRQTLPFAVIAAFLAACVTIEPPPNPRGAVKPGQRLIVLVNQAPGPWIVADPDSKAETAMKLLPIGNFLQGMQEDRINALSKEIQPYLPRPRYHEAVEDALIKALKAAHSGPVQTADEAGIPFQKIRSWNTASDQLDWRRQYYFTDMSRTSPRNYSEILSLDDAVILDVNLSFGLEPNEEDRTVPLLSAASRAYRADTTRILWSREERLGDKTSSSTLSEFRAVPSELTDRLYVMSVPLAMQIASGFSRDVGLMPAPPPILAESAPPTTFVNGAAVAASTAAAVITPYPVPTPSPAPAPFPDPLPVAPAPTDGLPSH